MSEEPEAKEELKPCPFCGADPDTVANYVECCNCDYQLPVYNIDDQYQEEEAINHWNTRPIEDALRRQLEEAKTALETQKKAVSELYQIENKDIGAFLKGTKESIETTKRLVSSEREINAALTYENMTLESTIAAQQAEIERLKSCIFDAFFEGYGVGYAGVKNVGKAWHNSDSKQALAGGEGGE